MTKDTQRKNAHVDAVLSGRVNYRDKTTGFENIHFMHEALPELHLAQIDMSTTFLGKSLALPFLISSMTGGPSQAETINGNLAEAAECLGIAFAVGSQRVAISRGELGGFGKQLRQRAPTVPIFANLGAVQLVHDFGLDELRRAVDMIEADALILHLNPLQEALQIGGNIDWRGVEAAIATVCQKLEVPIIVKEVGFGISPATAKRLASCGVSAIDIAGAGGTSWAAVEGAISNDPELAALAEMFRDWGVPTALSLQSVRETLPQMPLIGSGGIRTGLDIAKAIRLGADLVAQAGAVLAQAMHGPEAVISHFQSLASALRLACFVTGSSDLAKLRSAKLMAGPYAHHSTASDR